MMSITTDAGSGTAAFAMAPEPLPAVWPKSAPNIVLGLRAIRVIPPDDIVGGIHDFVLVIVVRRRFGHRE